jgi:ribonuclease HII
MAKVRAMRTLENALRRWGFHRIAGADEVGRGCLAGPVVAAAVILHPDRHISGLRDSKMLPPAERERLYIEITGRALGWAIASASPAEIDSINIYHASLQAMRRAVLAMTPLPDFVLVDAFRIPNLVVAQRGVVRGDQRCSAIAAASILAKVTRDREMQVHHGEDGRYGFDRHKGYATTEHLAALARHGYSALHRRSFRPPSLFDRLPLEELDAEIALEVATTA